MYFSTRLILFDCWLVFYDLLVTGDRSLTGTALAAGRYNLPTRTPRNALQSTFPPRERVVLLEEAKSFQFCTIIETERQE
jgi:hypothetical protein